MMLAGCGGLIVGLVSVAVALPPGVAPWIAGPAFIMAGYGSLMGAYMTYGSRLGKLRTREKLLDLAAAVRPWSGHDDVLDIGCGRGLMLIGAARRLAGGHAVGIDLWRAEDQTDNSPEAAEANARCEGVDDRIRIDTGDARRLPYAEASFDVVMSHWVVHNLPDAAYRRQALDEMLRVLRPGSVLVLADIAHLGDYRAHLLSRGMTDLHFIDGGFEAAVMGALSGGTYRPQALLARRP